MSFFTYVRAAAWLVAALTGCATTGATFRSGVGDTRLEHPPYVAGAPLVTVRAIASIGHVEVAYHAGAAQEPAFDPRAGAGTTVDSLVSDIRAVLGGAGITRTLGTSPEGLTPPDVRFGCDPHLRLAGEDCVARGDSALGRGRQEMQLAVGRPAPSWVAWAREALDRAGLTHSLVVHLEVGQYLVRQEGLAGRKVVELGTGHRVELPWLTSLEDPVAVLQLTAALVDREGRAVRIGAEGFHVRRTRLAVSALGARELYGAEDVRAARTARRDDLPGAPLAWQVALQHLIANVVGREITTSP
jgi:hypothetical protein